VTYRAVLSSASAQTMWTNNEFGNSVETPPFLVYAEWPGGQFTTQALSFMVNLHRDRKFEIYKCIIDDMTDGDALNAPAAVQIEAPPEKPREQAPAEQKVATPLPPAECAMARRTVFPTAALAQAARLACTNR
jgi:hypothetical protein